MALPIEPPDAYRALDGTTVDIPAPPPLADGQMPVFGPADAALLAELTAFRDRAIGRDLEHCATESDADWDELDPALQKELRAHFEETKKRQKEQEEKFAAARERCDARFGTDGLGFIDALNDGSALENFWASLNTLMYQRIPVMQYHAPEMQVILRDLLARFPERVWLPIVSQACWPVLEHRKSDHLYELMDRFIQGPSADFRHLETGAAKPEAESDLQPAIRKAVLQAAFMMLSTFASFKDGMAQTIVTDDISEQLARAKTLSDRIGQIRKKPLTDSQLDLIEELFRDIAPARTHDEGQTQSELNLHITNAYNGAMQAVMPGRPEGQFLRDMLSTNPYGFTALNLTHYPRQMVWPYLASHLDILDRAMGVSEPFYFEPRFERRKAVELIALLPKTPARYGETLFKIATGPDAGGREAAQNLLVGRTEYTQPACQSLTDRKAAIRVASADTLVSIGDPSALEALRAQHKVERAKAGKAALDNAIQALECGSLPDIEAILNAADTSTPLPDKLAWLSKLEPPTLTLADDRPAPDGFAAWLVADAARHGNPAGTARVDTHLGALKPASKAQFAGWTLTEWITYDTQPLPAEKVDAIYESAVQESYSTYEMFWDVREHMNAPEYSRDSLMPLSEWRSFARDRIAQRANYFINTKPYLNTAQPARGVLAIARHAPDKALVNAVASYLADHSKRNAQSKALLDCLATSTSADARKLLETCSKTQKQKSICSHALALLAKLA